MPWRWGPPNGRHSCLGPISLTSFRGRRVFSAFIDTTSPLLLTSSFLSSCCPACSMSRRGDFFFAYSSITQLLPACPVGGCHPHLPVRASCVFCRFHMGPPALYLLARPAVPHPSCPLTRNAANDVIVPSSRSSSRPACPHRPSPRHPTR